MKTIGNIHSEVLSASQTFVFQNADREESVVQIVVEISPLEPGSATLSASTAPTEDVLAEAANVIWFPFPSMPASASYAEIVTGSSALKLEVSSGEWVINIRRGMEGE